MLTMYVSAKLRIYHIKANCYPDRSKYTGRIKIMSHFKELSYICCTYRRCNVKKLYKNNYQ